MNMREKVANAMMGYGGMQSPPPGPNAGVGSAMGSSSSYGAKAYAGGGIIDRPAKVIAAENGPEAIVPISEEYIDMSLRDILKTFEARKIENKSQIEQSNMAVDQATQDTPAPASEQLGPEKQASIKTVLLRKLTRGEE